MKAHRTVRVSKRFLEALRNATDETDDRQLRCAWCFTIKIDHKKKCEVCGAWGNTRFNPKKLSNVYVENYTAPRSIKIRRKKK